MPRHASAGFSWPLIALVLFLFPGQAIGAERFDDGQIRHFDHPHWFVESPFNDLEELVDVSVSSGKLGLMVLFTTDGCSYCDLFIRESLGRPATAAMVRESFDSVGLEIFDDREMTDPQGSAMAVKQFARAEGVEFSPTLLFYGDDGTRLLRIVGYQTPERFETILRYLSGGYVHSESLADHFRRVAGKRSTGSPDVGLRRDPIFTDPPYALERRLVPAGQPLLVMFEKPGCAECDEFHTNVLELKEVRDVLKQFEVVRLDATDDETPVITPLGDRVTPAGWFQQTGFSGMPALIFFDDHGDKVLETDALVRELRMMNSLHFVLERAYQKGWTYQRFARTRALEKLRRQQQ